MFCKNCGSSIEEAQEICMNCGFRKGNGKKYCPDCGERVEEGQALCLHCRNCLDQAKQPTQTEPSSPADSFHLYQADMKKMTLWGIAANIMGLLLVLSFIFVPFYQITYTDAEAFLTDVLLGSDIELDLETGNASKSMSLYDDVNKTFQLYRLFSEDAEGAGNDDTLHLLEWILLNSGVILFGIAALLFIAVSIKETVTALLQLNDVDGPTKNNCAILQKIGSTSTIEMLSPIVSLNMVLGMLFADLLLTRIMWPLRMEKEIAMLRDMTYLSGVSLFIIVPLLLLGAHLVTRHIALSAGNRILSNMNETDFGA